MMRGEPSFDTLLMMYIGLFLLLILIAVFAGQGKSLEEEFREVCESAGGKAVYVYRDWECIK